MPVNHDVEKIGAVCKNNIGLCSGWFSGLSHVEMVEQVAAYGFRAFENLGSGGWEDRAAVKAKCEELGVSVGAVKSSGTIPGDGPVNPAFHEQFVTEVRAAIVRAQELGTGTLLALSGAERDDLSKEQQAENLVVAGKLVAPYLEDAGMTLVWEPLNVKVNHGGYFLVYSKDAADIVRRTGSPAVKFLFDIYHQQISEGDVIRNIQDYQAEIGHYHFGDNPGRHEPTTGELNYKNIFKAVYETGYRGVVAAEFGKTMETENVLRIFAECEGWE
jgi:hydroxypyruvate isomerase